MEGEGGEAGSPGPGSSDLPGSARDRGSGPGTGEARGSWVKHPGPSAQPKHHILLAAGAQKDTKEALMGAGSRDIAFPDAQRLGA